MPTNTRKTAAAAPDPKRNSNDPAALLMAALQASAKTIDRQRRIPRKYQQEQLAQPLTDRDAAALARLGWTGRLSSLKPSEPKPTAKVKPGPVINPATFADLTPERQASAQFWAGLCATLQRSNGRVWIPEAAAVAVQLGVEITGPSQLAARLTAVTGLPVCRPVADAGWLICPIKEEMAGAEIWAQLWNAHLQQFTDAIAAGD